MWPSDSGLVAKERCYLPTCHAARKTRYVATVLAKLSLLFFISPDGSHWSTQERLCQSPSKLSTGAYPHSTRSGKTRSALRNSVEVCHKSPLADRPPGCLGRQCRRAE